MKIALSPGKRGEYAPYFDRYVSLTPDGDLFTTLKAQPVAELLVRLPAERADFRYADGKWSVKEVLGHIIDTERIMAYRALRLGRNDPTPLPGFEQDPYVEYAGSGTRTMADLLEEFRAVRASTICLLRGMPEEAAGRGGVVSGNAVTVLALACIIAGHELHHERVLRDRYGLI